MTHNRNQSFPGNFSFSPPLVPLFTENTRANFERHMSNERRGYDSSTPSFSMNDITVFQSQPRSQPYHHNRSSSSEARASNSGIPTTEESVVPTLASVDDLLNGPGRNNLTYLNPDREGKDIWFRHDPTGKITKQILKMLKSDLPKPYPTYRSLPQEIKNRWFRAFAQEFNWNPSITESVRTAYDCQADLSFRSNLSEWKSTCLEKGVEELPEWMKAKKALFEGYIKMWKEPKVKSKADTNSKNRSSKRGGLGPAVHNNGAKTFELKWDEMTIESGHEPDMLKFMEETHLNKKTRTITDKKAKMIIDSAKEKIELTASQRLTEGDDSVQSNILTPKEINDIVLKEVSNGSNGKRHPYGFGNLLNDGRTSSTYTSQTSQQDSLLREEIRILKQREMEKDTKIQYLMQCNKLLLQKFPDICPPGSPDDDETQA